MNAFQKPQKLNVLNQPLVSCCQSPMTGFFRDGYCRTDDQDYGRHVICAQVTEEFLAFTKKRGNDLSKPVPDYDFPGLKPGDRWCLCAVRWKEALENNCAPPVILESCEITALSVVSLDELRKHQI